MVLSFLPPYMIDNKKIVAVFPASHTGCLLERAYRQIPFDTIDDVVIIDDKSNPDTVPLARELGIEHIINPPQYKSYGSPQKKYLQTALHLHADIIIIVSSCKQCTPELLKALAYAIAQNMYQVVLSRSLLNKNAAILPNLPVFRVLQNNLSNAKRSRNSQGIYAFSREVLESIPYCNYPATANFHQQLLKDVSKAGFKVAEVKCRYPHNKDVNIAAAGKKWKMRG